jgi:cyanophycin synthetase
MLSICNIRDIMKKYLRQIDNKLRKKLNQLLPQSVVRIVRRYFLVPSRRGICNRMPIAMITGTKGKTTTTRMLAHILSIAGHKVGFSSTNGVVINGCYVNSVDSAGYYGASMVVNNPTITAAVLEVARGDLLRIGLYIDRCNVAALLNVGREQIGIDGIDTLEEMASLKQRVINAAKGTVVLNADDSQCIKLIAQYPSHRLVLFSKHARNKYVLAHLERGGTAYVANNQTTEGYIQRLSKSSNTAVITIADLPSSANGLFPQNIANAMAAASLAEGMGVSLETIKIALQSFENSLECSPGRFNFIEGYSLTVLIDSAVHVPSCAALVDSLRGMQVSGRKICMFDNVGNRPGWHYTEIGEILGSYFDCFICFELERYRRGRAPGEISDLLKTGLLHAGVIPDRIHTAQGYTDATRALSHVVDEGDLVVILSTSANPHEYLPVFRSVFDKYKI